MTKYTVRLYYEATVDIEVEAPTPLEALELAENTASDDLSLADPALGIAPGDVWVDRMESFKITSEATGQEWWSDEASGEDYWEEATVEELDAEEARMTEYMRSWRR